MFPSSTLLNEQPYFSDLVALFGQYVPSKPILPEQLNQIAQKKGELPIRFVSDGDAVIDDSKYYEQIIYEDRAVPTRHNWHDTFNALMWMVFPRTKAVLNRQHVEDINNVGVHPRTRRRNRITHFDECGGILVYENDSMLEALINHQWDEAFLKQRTQWQSATKYFIFGHALYEMLLDPHIGLTGKYLPLKVDGEFWQLSLEQQYQWLDDSLTKLAEEQGIFASMQRIYPLPVLGIPGWHQYNDAPVFYENTDYFRPKRA